MTVSTTSVSAMRSPRNSSGITASVAPAALQIPSASAPDFRPIVIARYQRDVVRASSIRFSTIAVPTERAVSKPNVGALSGSGRSLSIVFGTVATPMRPFVSAAMRDAPNVVSSPPIVIR